MTSRPSPSGRPTPAGASWSSAIGQLELSDRPSSRWSRSASDRCIIVCAWDRGARLAGMAHVVQPCSSHGRPREDARYADQAVPLLLRRMAEQAPGPAPDDQARSAAPRSCSARRRTASRSACRTPSAVEQALGRFGLRVAARDVGGRHGRTVTFDPGTGEVLVRTLGRGGGKL